MNPVLVKALIGVGATAAVSSGGYGIYYFATAPRTIKEKLVKEGLTPLSFSTEEGNNDSTEWNQKLTKYNESGQESSRFADLPAKDTSTVSLENLKNRCRETLDMSLSDAKEKDILDKAKKWCFKGTIEK